MSAAQNIAHYRITGKLGQGGMGEVYRATDTRLGRDVAIKVLPANMAEDAARMARFEREAQMLAALNHPNIAAIYGIEQGALIMELVEGDDLKGPLPVDTAVNYARQIAEGLEAAHEKGIVHRDLKPANIKVTPAGVVKILDFGQAKVTEDGLSIASQSPTMSPTLSLAMTKAGMILGTAAYMSPEQARGKPVDKRADIWAFGVVLYEMLTGSMLFGGGETVTDSLAAVITREPDWAALPKDTAPRIRRLLERCLRKDPRQRMRDIGEARLIIDESEPPATVAQAVERRRRWLPWAVAGVFALLATVAAIAMFMRPKPVDLATARFTLDMPDGPETGGRAAPQVVPSPDGRYIAYIAAEKGVTESLWVRPLNSLASRKLDKTEGANYPFWSPDGQSIGFFADGKLKRIAVAGGSPQTLLELPKSGMSSSFGVGGTWSRDGAIVLAPGRRGLMRVPATGGSATPATALDEHEGGHSWPQFLPDGRHVLYFASGKDEEHSGIYVQEPGSSQRTLVMKNLVRAAWSPPGYLLFVRESTLFAQRMDPKSYRLEGDPIPVAEEVTANNANGRAAFAVSENGVLVYRGGLLTSVRRIVWVDRQGKHLEAVGKTGEYDAIRLSPDGKSAAVIAGHGPGESDTFSIDLATGVLTRLTLDSKSHISMGPWSPDSQRILVNRIVGPPGELSVASAKTRILETEARYCNDWSPDGRSLLCIDTGGKRLYLVPAGGGTGTRIILETPYINRNFQFSPGGDWVAYSSNESGGPYEVFVAAFPSFSSKRQISNGGGGAPYWTKNGKEIVYVAPDNTVMSVAIKTGPRLEAGVPQPLFPIPALRFRDFAISPTADGQRFLTLEFEQPNQRDRFMVVVNWLAELKQP